MAKRDSGLKRDEEPRWSFGDYSPLAFVYCDDELRIRDINPAGIEVIGLSDKSKVIGESIAEISLYASREGRIEKYREVLRTGKPVCIDDALVGTAKAKGYYRLSAFKSGDGIGIIMQDNNEEIRAKRELSEWQRLTKYIIQHDPNAIAVFDRELRYIFASDRFLKDYRVEIDDIIGKRHYDVFPEMPERWKEVHYRVLNGAIESSEEDYFRREDGSIDYNRWECRPWYDAEGKIGGMIMYTEVITERKMAERALVDSLEFNRAVIQHSPLGISVRNARGKLIIANPAWQKIWSVTPEMYEEYKKADPDELQFNKKDSYLGEWIPRVEQIYKKGGYLEIPELALKNHRSGEIRWISQIFYALKSPDGEVEKVVVLTQDITERKRSEQALRESEERFRAFFEHAPLGYQALDQEGRFIEVNEAWLETLGYRRDEVIGRWFGDFMAPEYVEAFRKRFPVFIDRGKIHSEFYMIHKNGEKRYIAFDGLIQRNPDSSFKQTHCIIKDDTERKFAEDALYQSEEKFRQIAETISDVFWVGSPDWGKVFYVSPAYENVWGRSVKSLYENPSSWMKSLHKDDLPLVKKAIEEKSNNKDGIPDFPEYRVILPDGSINWVQARAYPIFDEEGEIIRVVGIAENITEKKKAERELIDARDFAENLIGTANAIVVVLDKNGNIREFNKAAEKITGYSLTDLKGKSWFETIVPQDRFPEVWSEFEKLAEGGLSKNFENPILTKDGRERYIVWQNNELIFNGEIRGSVSFGIDITEKREAEKALKRTARYLEEAESTGKIGSWFWDPNTNETWASKNLFAIFRRNEDYGLPMEEWVGLIHPEDREMAREALQQAFESGKYECSFRLDNKNKEDIRWIIAHASVKFREDGKPDYFLGVAQDVTEQKLAKEKIIENQEKFRALFDQAPYSVVLIDSTTGDIIEYNEHTYKTLGYTREEFANLRIADIDVDEDEMTSMKYIRGIYDKGFEEFEARHRTRDGRILDIMVSARRIGWGNQRYYISIWNDITETKRLQELESRAQRLETAGRISGQIAHDFNNLLAPLITYPDFIREELKGDHSVLQFIDSMEEAAQRIAEINQQLLTLGRRGHYNQDVIDLNEILRKAVDECEINRGTISCDLILDPGLLKIKGGSAQIYRMITNLLVNARDAVQDVGRIKIKSESYYADNDKIFYGRIPKGEYVKLTISDTGCGIPEDLIEKIFDPFFTTKTTDRERGSGLGLSVVDSVIKDHHGYLDLKSKIGQGTDFYLYFPVCREAAVVSNPEQNEIVGGSEKILVVDDDPIQREVSSRVLMKLGYEVVTAENGEEAVEIIRDRPYDLVILDMIMPPGIDGAETYRQILEIRSGQKGIILSGFSESDRVIMAQELGARAFVKKPVNMKTLAAAVRAELDRVGISNQ